MASPWKRPEETEAAGLSTSPVFRAIMGGLTGLLGGGLPGAFGGVYSGILGAHEAQTAEEEAARKRLLDDIKIRREQLDLEGTEKNVAELEKYNTQQESRGALFDALSSDPMKEVLAEPAGAAPPPTVEQEYVDSAQQRMDEQRRAQGVVPPLPPPAPPPPQEETPILEPPTAEPVALTADSFEYPRVRVGDENKRRFNQQTILTADPDIILPHVSFAEVNDDVAKQHGYKDGWSVSYGYGKHDPIGQEKADVTEMTFRELNEFQTGMKDRQIKEGTAKYGPNKDLPTSAVGGFQITQNTLFGTGTQPGLFQRSGLSWDDKFTKENQIKLGKMLLEENVTGPLRAGEITPAEALKRINTIWEGAVPAGELIDDGRMNLTPPAPKPAPEEDAEFHPFRAKPNVTPDPAGIGALPEEQRPEALAAVREEIAAAEKEYMATRAALDSDPTLSRFMEGTRAANDRLLTKMAAWMFAHGTNEVKSSAVSMLNAVNARNQVMLAARAAAEGPAEARYKTRVSSAMEQLKAGNRLSLEKFKSTLIDGRNAKKAQLDRITNDMRAEKNDELKRGQMGLAQKLALEKEEIDRVVKQIDEIPKVENRLLEQQAILGDIQELRQLIEAQQTGILNKLTMGPLVGKLWNFTDASQRIDMLTKKLNAANIRRIFGGQPSEKESMTAIYELGPSIAQDPEVALQALARAEVDLAAEHDTQFGEYSTFLETNSALDHKPIKPKDPRYIAWKRSREEADEYQKMYNSPRAPNLPPSTQAPSVGTQDMRKRYLRSLP